MTHFVLCADTEDNHPSYSPGWSKMGSDYNANPARLRLDWTNYWDQLSELFRRHGIKVTWLLRTDDAVGDQVIRKSRQKILSLKRQGDEIGIHIHTLAWDGKIWRQTREPQRETEIVGRAIRQFRKVLGFSPRVSRMGWNGMSNSIMSALQNVGIRIDASAVPGYVMTGKRDNSINWKGTPKHPYHPHTEDYRKQGDMEILECPISSIKRSRSLLWPLMHFGLARSLILSTMGLFKHFSPHTVFTISPFWTTKHIKSVIENNVKNKSGPVVGYFHPSDVLNPKTGKMNMEYMQRLEEVACCMRKHGMISTTLSEACGGLA
jgi:hypothetical protein